MKYIFKRFICFLVKNVVPTVGITLILILCTCNFACQSNLDTLSFLNVEYDPPKIESFKVDSSQRLLISFNNTVQFNQCSLTLLEDKRNDIPVIINSLEEQGCYEIILEKQTELSKQYLFEGSILDKKGNTLTFEINFNGFNDHPAILILSEIRNAYSSKDKKAEFVELYVKQSGNLYGLSLISAYDGDDRKYSFLPVEVNEGEYITVHYRMIQDKEGCYIDDGMIDEIDINLALSTAVDSNDKARDFWFDNNKAVLGTSDILLLYNDNDDTVMDCIMWQPSDKKEWSDKFTQYLEKLQLSEKWQGEPLCSDGMTTINRSISRINTEEVEYNREYQNDAGQWIVACITSRKKDETMIQGATPGSLNSKNAYVKQ